MKKFLALAFVCATGSAFAGDWIEIPDAIEMPPGQVTVGAGALTGIVGDLHTPEDIDLYCIKITDEALFRATTSDVTTTISDTQLFLFDMMGMGIAMNDDDGLSLSGFQSTLTSAFVTSNGYYMIGVSSFDNDPGNGLGYIWADGPFGAERAPDGAGAGAPLGGWDHFGGEAGHYRIALRGAEFCHPVPEPATMAGLGLGALALIRRRRVKKA